MIDISNVKEIEYFSVYFNSYGPAILGMLNTLNIMTISSISLEKDNMQIDDIFYAFYKNNNLFLIKKDNV